MHRLHRISFLYHQLFALIIYMCNFSHDLNMVIVVSLVLLCELILFIPVSSFYRFGGSISTDVFTVGDFSHP